MDFARKLEDARRVLANMGLNYSSRLDNEDTIVMLMKKLPEEGLKRKWADKAGDLIKSKGRAEYIDFVEFVKKVADRINNRDGQELRSSYATSERDKRDLRKERPDQPCKVTTLAAVHREQRQQISNSEPVLVRKCSQCSGPHGIWRCWKFKSSSPKDRLRTVKQQNLCRICLGEGHDVKSCAKGFTCRISGCGKDHHYLIHSASEDNGENYIRNSNYSTSKGVESNTPTRDSARPSSANQRTSQTVCNITP